MSSDNSGSNQGNWYQTTPMPPEQVTPPPSAYNIPYNNQPTPAGQSCGGGGNYAPDYNNPGTADLAQTVASLQSALQTVQQAQQSLATQVTGNFSQCANTVSDAQNYVLEQIVNKLQAASSCTNNCQEYISGQLGSTVGTGMGNAATVIERCPACPDAPDVFVSVNYTPPDNLLTPNAYIPGVQGGGGNRPQGPSPIPPINLEQCNIPPADCSIYRGWCNTDTGDIDVIMFSDLQLFPPWVFVVAGPDKQAVTEATKSWCVAQQDKKKKYGAAAALLSNYGAEGPGCDIDGYKTQEKNDLFFSDVNYQQFQAFAKATLDQLADTTITAVSAPSPEAGAILGAARGMFRLPVAVGQIVIPKLVELMGCLDPRFTNAAKMLALLKYWGDHVGIDFTAFRKIYDYTMNINCRQRHLSPDQAMAAYLADSVSEAELDIYWGIHGFCHADLTQALQASKAKPVPGQLADLRRRKIIGLSEYRTGMRKLGYLEPAITEDLFRLTENVPSIGQVVQFANSDVTNNDNATILQLDVDIDARLPTHLRDYLHSSGVTDQQIIEYWRSHWNIPAAGSLFTAYHRLRRDVSFGTPEQQGKRLRAAVDQQGMLPEDSRRLFAIRYNPLSFRYLRIAHQSGAIPDDGINDRFALLGFSDADCDVLTKEFMAQKEIAAANARPIKLWLGYAIDGNQCKAEMGKLGYDAKLVGKVMGNAEIGFVRSAMAKAFVAGEFDQGSLTQEFLKHGLTQAGIDQIIYVLAIEVKETPALDDYIDGVSDRQTVTKEMTDYGMAEPRVNFLLDKVDTAISRDSIKACVRGIKKQFNTGGITEQQANQQLINAGLIPLRATILVQNWQCEQSSKGKHVAVGVLCGWVSNGSIQPMEFVDRLVKIGYDRDDALNMLTDCLAKINDRIARKATADAKAGAAAAAKQAANAAKAAKQLERDQAQLSRARAVAAATKKRREGQLLSAADKLQAKLASDISTALRAVSVSKQYLQDQYALTVDEALQAILLAAENFKGKTVDDFGALVQANAQLIVDTQLSDASSSNSSLGSMNGSTQPV